MITEITLKLSNKNIKLTVGEAQQLRKELNEIFKGDDKKEGFQQYLERTWGNQDILRKWYGNSHSPVVLDDRAKGLMLSPDQMMES